MIAEQDVDPVPEEQGDVGEIPLAGVPNPLREEQEQLGGDVLNMRPHLDENVDELPVNNNLLPEAGVSAEGVVPINIPIREEQEQLGGGVLQPHLDENRIEIPINNNDTQDTGDAATPMVQFQTDADFQLAVDLQLAYDIADAPSTPEKREKSKRDRRTISKLNYEVFTCCVCTKHFQTNDFPSLEDGEHVCSAKCYRQKRNDL